MQPATFYLSAMQWLLLLASLAIASPVANPSPNPIPHATTESGPTTELMLVTAPARRDAEETTPPTSPALHERQNPVVAPVIQAKMVQFRACCAKAVASIKPDPLKTLGLTMDKLVGLYVAGGMLVFGGELSDFARRIVWQQLAIAVMLCGSNIF